MVRKGGLEPPHLSVPDPKSGASANSATFAIAIQITLNITSFYTGQNYITASQNRVNAPL